MSLLSRSKMSLFLLAVLMPPHVYAQEFRGVIEKVVDGDTVTVAAADGKSFRIRLADIDAPERDQPWGMEATLALTQMGLLETARVRVEDTDRYGRLVATLFVGTYNLNKEMIKNGHAWVYRKYLRDQSLPGLQETAKKEGKGLWAYAGAIEPSVWRRGGRKTSSRANQTSSNEPRVKRSRSNICHEAGSRYYSKTKNFVGFDVLSDCLKSGGRLPNRN